MRRDQVFKKRNTKFEKKDKEEFDDEDFENNPEWEDVESDDEENREDSDSKENNDNESIEESEHSDSDSEAEIYKENEKEEKEVDKEIEVVDGAEISKDDKKEFNNYLNGIRSNVDDINKKMTGLIESFKSEKAETKYGLSYLDAKNNLMIMYLTNLISYSLLKVNGNSVNKHSLIKKLILEKTILEKSKVIDLKLKPQIDRLIKLSDKDINASTNDAGNKDNQNYKPQILEDEEEEEAEKVDEEEKKKMKYQVNKNLQEFFETTDENKNRLKKIQKMKEKMKNSEIYQELKEQFNDAPMEVTTDNTEYDKLMRAVEEYEEENFRTLKISKRDIKTVKKQDRLNDDFANIGKEFKHLDNILLHDEREELNAEKKFLGAKRAINEAMNKAGSNSKFKGNSKGNKKGNKGFNKNKKFKK